MYTRFTNSKRFIAIEFFLITFVVIWVPFLQASTPIVHEIPLDASEAMRDFDFWKNEINLALEDEDLPIYWAERAVNYVFRGRDNEAMDRARYLLGKVVEQEEPSAAALYRIANSCGSERFENWCAQNSIFNKLKDADPENVAVYFADFPFIRMNEDVENLKFLDNEKSRERLRQAALATHVDEYYSRDAMSWAQLARKVSVQLPPPGQAVEALIEYFREGIPENQLHGHHRPIEGVIWNHVHTGSGSSPLNGLPHLCKLMARLSDEEGVMHCELISDLFLFEWAEPRHPYIGYQIKHSMISAVDAESPELERLEALWKNEWDTSRGGCDRPVWSMNGIIPNGGLIDLNLYYQDLQNFSYIVANRKAVEREMVAAGLPDSECRDHDNVTVIMKTYWPDYQPPQNDENP